MTSGRKPTPARRWAALAAAVALLLNVAVVAAANAQLDQPTDGNTPVDTDLTPKPKEESPFWTRIAGAEYGESDVPPDSVTPFDLDFFDVAFLNTRIGFAGGAQCVRSNPDVPVPAEETKTCARVPVIYRYTDPLNAPARWEEVYRGEGEGYVGAIAFTAKGLPVAVGGDGVYPRREITPTGPEATYQRRVADDLEEGAGSARAWVYRDGAWDEVSGDLPDGMRGLSALDFHPKFDLGFAGALGQLWEWEEGRFTGTKFDRETKSPGSRAALFEFRVREIRFLPHETRAQAIAVTAGCCAESEAFNTPRILAYDGEARPQPKWFVRKLGYDPADYDPLVGTVNIDSSDGTAVHRRVDQRPWLPDSFYSFTARTYNAGEGTFRMSAIVSIGGPRPPASDPPC